jgi:hypothetical protein
MNKKNVAINITSIPEFRMVNPLQATVNVKQTARPYVAANKGSRVFK